LIEIDRNHRMGGAACGLGIKQAYPAADRRNWTHELHRVWFFRGGKTGLGSMQDHAQTGEGFMYIAGEEEAAIEPRIKAVRPVHMWGAAAT
jgi:hypothetical protein